MRITSLLIGLAVAFAFTLAPSQPADAQSICSKISKKGKVKYKLRDTCLSKETLVLDLGSGLGVADRCTWVQPISVGGADPRGCAPGIHIGDRCTTTTSCDPGEFAAAGACQGDPATSVAASLPDGTTGWTCELLRTEEVAFVGKWTAGVLCCE